MKDAALEQLRQVLPELFDINREARRPGGMCTPGSGCPPEVRPGEDDLLRLLGRAAEKQSEEAGPDDPNQAS